MVAPLLARMLGLQLDMRAGRALLVAMLFCALALRLLVDTYVFTAGVLAPRAAAL